MPLYLILERGYSRLDPIEKDCWLQSAINFEVLTVVILLILNTILNLQSTANGEFGENIQNVQKPVEVENSQEQDLKQWLKVTGEHALTYLLKQ